MITIAILLVVFLNQDVYSMISSDPGVRVLAIFLWVILGLSFAFLYYDFYSFTGIRRENAELDNAIYSDALTGITFTKCRGFSSRFSGLKSAKSGLPRQFFPCRVTASASRRRMAAGFVCVLELPRRST